MGRNLCASTADFTDSELCGVNGPHIFNCCFGVCWRTLDQLARFKEPRSCDSIARWSGLHRLEKLHCLCVDLRLACRRAFDELGQVSIKGIYSTWSWNGYICCYRQTPVQNMTSPVSPFPLNHRAEAVACPKKIRMPIMRNTRRILRSMVAGSDVSHPKKSWGDKVLNFCIAVAGKKTDEKTVKLI